MRFFKKQIDRESKQLFRNSTWVFFSNFYSTALAFLRSIAIARGLGAEIYGTFSVIVAFVALIQEFLNLNIGTALIKFGAVYHTDGRNDKVIALVRMSLRISAWMAIISVILVSLLLFGSYSSFIEKPGLEWFIIAYAIVASVTYINSISRGLLRLYYKFKLSSTIQMIMDSLETIAIILVVFFYPQNLNKFFVVVILTRFVNGFICNLLAFRELKHELILSGPIAKDLIAEDKKPFRDFVIGNSLGNSLKTVITQGDVVLLGFLSTAEQVGFYAVAKKLAYSVLTLSDPLVSSIYPQLTRLLAEKKYKEVRHMLIKVTSLAMIPGMVFMIGAFFLNEWIITTIYGNGYAGAAPSFNFFVIGAVFGAVTFWTLPLVQSLGLVKMRLKAYAITILSGSVLAWYLIPTMHASGMALALLTTNLINMLIFIIASNRAMKVSMLDNLAT